MGTGCGLVRAPGRLCAFKASDLHIISCLKTTMCLEFVCIEVACAALLLAARFLDNPAVIEEMWKVADRVDRSRVHGKDW